MTGQVGILAAIVNYLVAMVYVGFYFSKKGSGDSAEDESFTDGLLEYPQYTRPAEFQGMGVPEVLLSGHHANIEKWRRQQSLVLTREKRPDLFEKIVLTKQDKKLLQDHDNSCLHGED